MRLNTKIFAERLRQVRKSAGLTGAKLAKAFGMQKSAIANLESGGRSPAVDTLYKLAITLNVSSDFLLGLPSPPHVPGWVLELMPELESLDHAGREAVKAVIKSLSQRDKGGPKA
ncbi:MAG: helix-turn-helix domain-containing protein [Deltaproteobacteria bacterium]|jgi:transcriptional regulator with XRE-family HTH domain|nr:helix-turn-helix domain-containing protein [Deltaproteobacteria bacterium]